MNHRSRAGVLVIIMVLALAQSGATGAAPTPTAPAGLTSAEWRDVQAQLPPSRPSGMDQTYLKSPSPAMNDWFGTAIAISGDTLVIGAPGEDGVGGAHVFVRVNGNWAYQDCLRIGAIDSGDDFGAAVDIDGDTIVVGAWREDSTGAAPLGEGAAYVFVRANGEWTLQAALKAANADLNDWFGHVVAIDGDTLVIGAPGESSAGGNPADNSATGAGAAYVFTRANGVWSQTAYLKAANADQWDEFGYAVAIDGPTIVVGARGERSNGSGPANNSVINAGAVYVFERANGAWSQQAYLKAPVIAGHDIFGDTVLIDGDTIVVGAPHSGGPCCRRAGANPADPAVLQTGEAFVFGRTAGVSPTWTFQANLRASNADISDGFGVALAIDGDTIVVGAPGEDSDGSSPADNAGDESGAIYVFGRSGTVWTELSYRKAFNPDINDNFGWAVAIADGTLVVGAPHESSDGSSPANNTLPSGAVYVQQVGARLSIPRVQR